MSQEQEKPGVLVVEDEESIRKGLCDVLAYHGYAPTGVSTGEDGLREALAGPYALVILDVMLPGLSGFDVCEALRGERPLQPILMLTARGSEEDVLDGFRRGADDYVSKPFSISELLARVEALLRRSGKLPRAAGVRFRFGSWEVDPERLRASGRDRCVDLSQRELEILALFAREEGRIVSRRILLQEVWGFANADRIETRTVDMQIGKLRRKIDEGAASWIETVRGAGYRYNGSPS